VVTEHSSAETVGLRGPWGLLPPRMRVLFVTTHHQLGDWLARALVGDSASEVQLERAYGAAAGVSRLRNELFDAVFVSHVPDELDALEFVAGIRAGNPDQAVVVLGAQSEQAMGALCYEVGADGYLCVGSATTRALLWTVARGIERHAILAENRQLQHAERHRLQMEHHEVERLLTQQRVLTAGLEAIKAQRRVDSEPDEAEVSELDLESDPLDLPAPLLAHYRELLRTYVIMGSGNLTEEMQSLAELLATGGVSARQTMQLHLAALEELIRGLGNRSARHVMNRADLLIVEMMMHLAEGYRQRYVEEIWPPRQKLLPGVEGELVAA
jgi:DNA-binding response OmpR family regulator